MQACAVARCAGLLASVGAEASAWEAPVPSQAEGTAFVDVQEKAPPPGLNQVFNSQPARVKHQTPCRPSIAHRPFKVGDLDIARGPSRPGDAAWAGGPSPPVSDRARPRPPTARPATATGTHRPAL
jgi:hypothetical protein